MGYTTNFHGAFELDRPLEYDHFRYLTAFSATRRMKRDVEKIKGTTLETDGLHTKVGLGLGLEGGYVIAWDGSFDQHPSVIDSNHPPEGQPGLWCQWVPMASDWCPSDEWEEGEITHFGWDAGEKFYHYIDWLRYVITHFLEPWGYKLSGSVSWSGEDVDDVGKIEVINNKVFVYDLESSLSPQEVQVKEVNGEKLFVIEHEGIRVGVFRKDGILTVDIGTDDLGAKDTRADGTPVLEVLINEDVLYTPENS